LTHANVTISSPRSSASPAGEKAYVLGIDWESLRDQLYAQYLKSSPLLLSTRNYSDTKLLVSWTVPVTKSGTERTGVRIVRSTRSSMGLSHDKAKLGFPDSGDSVLSWERKRAQEAVAYVGNKLIGIHLTPDEARTIYNRLVASTWPDDGSMKWPPAPRDIALAKLATERRIKE
jgi:hypothetical protein